MCPQIPEEQFGTLAGCEEKQFDIEMRPTDADVAIRHYYAAKYPVFGELVKLSNSKVGSLKSDALAERLWAKSPVETVVHSSPHGPFCTYVERTEKSQTRVTLTSVDLYAYETESCHVVIRTDSQKKRPGDAYSTLPPLTEKGLRDWIRAGQGKGAREARPRRESGL
jgi:hypothetical protein